MKPSKKRTSKRTFRPDKFKLKYNKLKRSKTKVNNTAPDIIADILKAVPLVYYIPAINRSVTAPFSFGFQEFNKPPCWCKIIGWFKYWFFCSIEIQTGGTTEYMVRRKKTARLAMEQVHAAQMELRVVHGA